MTQHEKERKQHKTLSDFFSASQMRSDRWTTLKGLAAQLVDASEHKREKIMARTLDLLDALDPIEAYWAFPGNRSLQQLRRLLARNDLDEFAHAVSRITRALMSGSYRRRYIDPWPDSDESAQPDSDEPESPEQRTRARNYFEVLVVDDLTEAQEDAVRDALRDMRRDEDKFVYSTVVVPSLTDALIAVMFNYNIQSVVVRNDFNIESGNKLDLLRAYLDRLDEERIDEIDREECGPELCRLLRKVRPEVDVFLVTDRSVEDIASRGLAGCRRVFYNLEDYMELHLNILRGVYARYQTPFFTALKEYSRQPTGVFHAMPISRGKSIIRSNWIRDMGDFYGMNIFLAETSATSGGLDSLLEPQGPIKRAQELAARAFGSRQTFFATNGTSTCNKIVVQAIVRPGDIVLIDRDCHKSHHYGMVLAGAHAVYLDSYPLSEYSMYGAVPLSSIKRQLLELKRAGKLDRVRMLLLTNCTFDGIVYNVERVMQECLAIKPDLVFLWDEAWFAFARFGGIYRQRTAMHVAQTLRDRYRSEDYRKAWDKHREAVADLDDEALVNTPLMPDPDKVRVRVYSTQSTHKTLTALRQGSMIHVHDQDFSGEVEQAFHEAYMTHTSTSPNYQIIASLDVGRRQVELEGYELVQKQIEAAMTMRKAVASHPLLSKYFTVLSVGEMIPAEYRESGIESYWDPEHGWNEIWHAWAEDEFALDATRVTLAVGQLRRRRRHLQEQRADGQVRHPDQQDLAQHGAVHDQHRHHPLVGGLPDRGAAEDRPGNRERARGRQRHDPQVVRQAGARADRGAAAAAGLLPLPRALPQPRRQGHPGGRPARRLLPGLRREQVRVLHPRRRLHGGRPSTRAANWSRPRSSFPTRPDFRSWFPARWCPRKSSSSCARWT